MNQEFVINPFTNRKIAVGSTIYNRLLSRGEIQPPISRAYNALNQDVYQQQQQQQRPLKRCPPPPPSRRPIQRQIVKPIHYAEYAEDEYKEEYSKPQQKPKKTPEQKINSVLVDSSKVLKSVKLPEDEDEERIREILKNELLKMNNKYINKYLSAQ